MNSVIIGSTAAQRYNLSRRKPSDLDMWCDEEIPLRKGLDVKIIPSYILESVDVDKEGYATPNSLFTIKCSHLGWDNPAWNKHYLDVLFMKQKGCIIQEELFQKLTEYWKTEFGDKSFLSLKQGKGEFFTDYLNYIYDHDILHEVASSPNKPVYGECLRAGESVLIDKDKFFSMGESEQIRMFQEEMHVILFERWVIPQGISWMKAYPWSVRKTITSLTKGWATEFIIRNIDKFYKPDIDMVRNLNNFIGE